MTAYEQGYHDAERGLTLKQCPFMRGTGMAIAWRAGWHECYRIFEHNQQL